MRDPEGPIAVISFELFFREAEPRLHDALSACLGGELGREAAADALAYGWENWESIGSMNNPIGYLYVVGRDKGRKARRTRRVGLQLVEESRLPWIEPGLVFESVDVPGAGQVSGVVSGFARPFPTAGLESISEAASPDGLIIDSYGPYAAAGGGLGIVSITDFDGVRYYEYSPNGWNWTRGVLPDELSLAYFTDSWPVAVNTEAVIFVALDSTGDLKLVVGSPP